MTRLEKIQLAIEKGYTCDIDTGKVYSRFGRDINSKQFGKYKIINLKFNKKHYILSQHQFIYYIATGKIVDEIDHINEDKTDNRIINLRSVTRQQNQHNRMKTKGYCWHKRCNKWIAQIVLNNKPIHLGYFDREDEAHQAYLDAKKIYHNN